VTPRPRRILALVHHTLVPPDDPGDDVDILSAKWKTEFDVIHTLREIGHEVRVIGVDDDLTPIRDAVRDFKPHVAFNLLESFDDVQTWDQNVVAYLELLKVPYTGCNARGLMLGRDKALTKKLLSYHRISVADFVIFPRGRRIRRPRRLAFPLIVKSRTLDASVGISQASVVHDDARLEERVHFIHDSVGTDALVESYIDGRELYVGLLGNQRLEAFPVWELSFAGMSDESYPIATERLKWNAAYQKRHGIASHLAKDLSTKETERIQHTCRRVFRILNMSGYARIDLRLTESGRAFFLEANPNPQLAYGEDFAESAEMTGLAYEALLQRIVNLGMRWKSDALG
jgi:D-alanine-D-alanine ligase